MSVCADANITGTFLHFWTHKVHYKLVKLNKAHHKISTMVAFCPVSYVRWSFVRTPVKYVHSTRSVTVDKRTIELRTMYGIAAEPNRPICRV